MKDNTIDALVGFIGALVVVVGLICFFTGEPAKSKTVTLRPVQIPSAQKIGENVGSKTGRFIGGFFKGLWKREENK